MGKKLIIKGADFSEYAVSKTVELEIEQNGINMLSNTETYGENSVSTSPNFPKRVRTITNIQLELGQSVRIRGLKGLNNDGLALVVGAIWYSRDERSNTAVVGTLYDTYGTYFPLNTEGEDSVIFVNNFGNYYFGFTFAGPNLNEGISASDYDPLQVEFL